MPFTFSAGSFTFLKSSTTASQIDNNVDNVNKNNINVNDNLEIGNNCLPLANTLNVIPLERSRSLDNPRNNTGGNLKNSNNRKAWYKSLFVRIHHTLSPSRWTTDDSCSNNKINNNSDCPIINNTVDDNIKPGEHDNVGDDDPIMMKSRSIIPEIKKNTFVRHGLVHDFYIETKDYNLKLKPTQVRSNTFNGAYSSTTFEKCAQTPRHFAKEAEVLGKVGRFTIVREREDFDTTYFDQCHCQQKPCRFSKNGCSSGTHPILPPESLPQLCNKNNNNNNNRQQAAAIAHQQSNKHNSWSSPSSKPRNSLYCNPAPYSNSSRHSLPPLQNNGVIPVPIVVSKVSAASFTNCRGILSQSASSPNLVHLNQRIKSENIVNKHPTSRNNNNGRFNVSNNIIVSGKNPSNNGSYYPQSTTNSSVVKKVKKPSLINMKSTEFVLHHTSSTTATNSQSTSTPPTPTYPSKFSHHNSNEPHTTINSHSGRKFEVEWSSSLTATSSSTSSTSSTSSSDPSPSPSSTISSVFSMGSSPDKSTTNTLSRRCSTLSSKCGRKFEVTILSSSGNGNSSLLNISPHSTINNTIVSSPVETEFTKC